MLYKLAHILKERFGFIWDFVEWGNATAFSLIHRQQLKSIPQVLADCSGEYQFRLAKPTDVSTLVTFFANQPEDAYEFFKPHDFDATSIKKVIDNKAFQSIVVWKEQTIVGYFFLRCFVNGKCFRGKIVDKNWQGRGIAKQMGIGVTLVRYMRIGRTYQNVPWPEEKRELLHPDTLPDLTFILLKYPMSEKEDEFSALLEDYRLTPSILAVTMLRLVRRALEGDRDLALCLLVLGGYENIVGRIMLEESALASLMYR
jgi:hypothetical protein